MRAGVPKLELGNEANGNEVGLGLGNEAKQPPHATHFPYIASGWARRPTIPDQPGW